MKIGFLFPGQGSQNVGMGKDIYDKYEEAREIYKKANNTEYGIKVIIYFTEDEYKKVNSVLEELELTDDPNTILIDARKDNKISASNEK